MACAREELMARVIPLSLAEVNGASPFGKGIYDLGREKLLQVHQHFLS